MRRKKAKNPPELKRCPCCRRDKPWAAFVPSDKRCDWCRGERKRPSSEVSPAKPSPPSPPSSGEKPAAEVPEFAKFAIDAVLELAERARGDFFAFYDLCIRGEDANRSALRMCPHQRLMARFLLDFRRAVVRTPVFTHKTYTVFALLLWLIGTDVAIRTAFASRTIGMAQKVVEQLQSYISDPQLGELVRLVFPWLRVGDTKLKTEFDVERPAGIRDATCVALGVNAGREGARYNVAVVDDVQDAKTVLTQEQRDATHEFVSSSVIQRAAEGPSRDRRWVIGTPWHRDDVGHRLELKYGWPTLVINIYGEVKLSNVPEDWASDALVDSDRRPGWKMLRHLADRPHRERTICDASWPPSEIRELERSDAPHEFARLRLCEPFSEGDARCHRDWIEACKTEGRGLAFVDEYDGINPTYTGVDLAIGHHDFAGGRVRERRAGAPTDLTSVVTFEQRPDGKRRILRIDSGRWSGPEILEVIERHALNYGSVVSVESNAAQAYLVQFLNERRSSKGHSYRIRSHHTTLANKIDKDFGVESVFADVHERRYVFPCSADGEVHEELAELFDEMIMYRPPPAHTGDRLMALWIAALAARRNRGARDPKPSVRGHLEMATTGGF